MIILAATNRPEILDSALLRPGRFDRQVLVDQPDLNGREAILRLHAQHVRQSPRVDLRTIAQRTPGFVGADLANVVNEAALLAAQDKDAWKWRTSKRPSTASWRGWRKNRLLSDKEKEIVVITSQVMH